MTCGSGVRSGMAATIPPGRAEPLEPSCVIGGSRWACQEDTAPGGMLDITEQIDRADTGVLSAIWDRLASFLELHAAAEEAIFYPVLLQVGLAAQRAAGV